MGIHYWSKSAVLTLLVVLSIGHAHAATRKQVSMPSDGQVIGSGNGSSRSGDTLYVPGDGKTEYIPSSYGGGSKGTKLPIKPTYDYSIPRTVKGMVGTLKGGNLAGIGLTIGLQYMLDQVGGFIDENGQPVKRVPDDGTNYSPGPTDLKWAMAKPHSSTQTQPVAGSASAVCTIYGKAFAAGYTGVTYVGSSITGETATQATCNYQFNQNGQVKSGTAVAIRTGETCPAGYDRTGNNCVKTTSGTTPLTQADYDLMEAAAAAKDSEWLKERLREHCEGSLNPQGCYDDLRENTWLEGPASVTEPGPTVSTTGPSGTTTTTNNTKIDITYGDNYYDYRKTKTSVVTKPDGTTETTTETEPETEQPREEEEQDINFSDSEFPPVEPFYQQKYPEGLEGVWQDAQSKFDNSDFMSFLHSFVPQFSGSCPSWSMSFNIASWASYGNVPFVNLCYVFDFIKVIMLVTALFTARAITFGG